MDNIDKGWMVIIFAWCILLIGSIFGEIIFPVVSVIVGIIGVVIMLKKDKVKLKIKGEKTR